MVPALVFTWFSLAPVMEVTAASTQFVVDVVVATLEEEGRWQETYQVTLSLIDVVSVLSPLSAHHRAYRFQVNVKYLYEGEAQFQTQGLGFGFRVGQG